MEYQGDVKITGHEDGGDFIFLDRKVIAGDDNEDEEDSVHSVVLEKMAEGTTTLNDLMYQNQPFTKRYTWREAKGYCQGFNTWWV